MSKKIFELFKYQCLHGIEKYCNFAVDLVKRYLINTYFYLQHWLLFHMSKNPAKFHWR